MHTAKRNIDRKNVVSSITQHIQVADNTHNSTLV